MSELSEEKIIDNAEKLTYEVIVEDDLHNWDDMSPNEIATIMKGLLDLYQKEKETSHFLQSELDQANAKIIEEREKNKWKPISEYNREKYDWVLVKYFDGDYECVPEVAEKRSDGKWYTSEREIPFEVKYFFDMQELLEERN